MSDTNSTDRPDPAAAVNESATNWEDVVQPVHETPSEAVAEQKLRHKFAETEYATPQERRQAATEKAAETVVSYEGGPGFLHATEEPTLAVADDGRVEELTEQQDRALADLQGAAPVGSEAYHQQEEDNAKARGVEADRASESAQAAQEAARTTTDAEQTRREAAQAREQAKQAKDAAK